ncbi:MAG TPA: metalloregulator ArsR/SmtB family transcription factor [Caulobacteraceae bacterium]|jgi:DNA-binding transcriptional ArsR family regulator
MVDGWLADAIGNQMVELETSQLDAVFHALGDPTRRAMLQRLADEPLSVGALASPHRMSLAAASKHIKALERAGLVRRQVIGRSHICHLVPSALADADHWLAFYRRFWSDSFEALDAVLSSKKARGDKP